MIPKPLASLSCLYLAKETPARTGSAWLAFIAPEVLEDAARAFLAAGYHLEDVSGIECAEAAVSVYHFDHFDAPGRVTLAVGVAHDNASFPSIASIYQGAEWHERETTDFFGFQYAGNPNPVPLLLADDMGDVNPLRKSESARAPLRVIFAAPERGSVVKHKADGFTWLDEPVVEKPAEAAPATETPGAAQGIKEQGDA